LNQIAGDFMKNLILLVTLSSLFGSFAALAETTAVITDPTHEESNLPLAYSSDAGGTCRYLGYDKEVKNSKRNKLVSIDGGMFDVERDSIVLDQDGFVKKQANRKVLSRITCIKN
jgi:hypothetical protein